MKLTIKNSGDRKFQYHRVMNGQNEFCVTKNIDDAELIQRVFLNVEINNVKKIPPSINTILHNVLKKTGIDLTSDFSRKTKTINVRFIYCKIARDQGFYLREIGDPIRRPHDCVLYAIRKFDDYYQTDPEFRKLYYKIKNISCE